MNIKEIMQDYTSGKKTLPETNQALKEAGAGFYLEPGKNALTEQEIRSSTIGHYPDMANGFGLLDSGTGTMDKVEVRNGKLLNVDMGNSYAMFTIAGRTYYVKGTELTDKKPEDKGEVLPDDTDKRRHPEWAGQTRRQRTKKGVFDVTYNEDGYHVKSVRV